VLGGLPVSPAIFALADGMAALLVFALLFGVANGLVTIVRGSLVPQYFGREHVGRISGAMSGIALFARAAGHGLAAAGRAGLPRNAAGARGDWRGGGGGVRIRHTAGALKRLALQSRLVSVITSFSRRIWKRVRKLLPSSTNSIGTGTMVASTS
jgi:hypothetical protein